MEHGELRESFRRQRRNLLIISLVLLYAEVSDLTIKQLSFLGNTLEIGKPTTVIFALWVGWAYWLWRYYSYHHDLKIAPVRETFRQQLTFHLHQITLRLAYDELAKNGKLIENTPFEKCQLYNPREKSASLKGCVYDGKLIEPLLTKDQFGAMQQREHDIEVTIPLFSVWRTKLRISSFIVFSTHLFSEYVLPYFVASTPAVYWVAVNGRSWITSLV